MIHEYLGQGDLGRLFRALGPDARPVAVKVLRSLSATRVRARFPMVARRLGAVRHTNLATMLAFGEQDGAPYVVVQYAPGGSLADLLRRPPVERPTALSLLRGAAAGIDHAHRSGLVHGALKPQQIVLDGDGRAVVTDFGLAPLGWPRLVGDRPPPSLAPYAAPELADGGHPTTAADRYAFAAIAQELLTGRPPQRGEDAAPGEELDAVLRRGLAEEPRARWRTCTEMVDALARASGMQRPRPRQSRLLVLPPPRAAATDAPAGPEAPAVSPLRRPGHPLVGVAGLALLLVAAAGVALWLTDRGPSVSVGLSRGVARAGDSVVVTATGLPSSQAGMIELHSEPEQIGTFDASRSGQVRTVVVLPQDVAPGDHVVTLCWDGACHGKVRIMVVEERPRAASRAETGATAAADGPPAPALGPTAVRVATAPRPASSTPAPPAPAPAPAPRPLPVPAVAVDTVTPLPGPTAVPAPAASAPPRLQRHRHRRPPGQSPAPTPTPDGETAPVSLLLPHLLP